MTITAFGTGMELQLGVFNVGWVGLMQQVMPVRWTRRALPAPRVWVARPVTQTHWEER